MGETSKLHSKILIGIPVYQADDRFLEALPKFIESCKEDYTLQCITVPNRTLVDAQNYIATYFLDNTDYDYLLLLEDDHWGHKKEMLDALVNKDVDICAMNYYSRYFPFYSCLMRRLPNRPVSGRYAGHSYTEGFYKVDLAGYAMMLIKRNVFEKLEKPYFRLNKYEPAHSYATDIDFCERVHEAGLDVWGCFDYVLAHRDITKENRMEKFLEGLDKQQEENLNARLNRRIEKCQVS